MPSSILSSTSNPQSLSPTQLQRATRTRKILSIASSLCCFIAFLLLLLALIGTTSNKAVIRDIWIIKLDMSNVLAKSVPNAALINTIAQSLGMSDFYQVGLWNHCEGIFGEGITSCDKPRAFYWFDPMMFVQELLGGAEIGIPKHITQVFQLIKTASAVMFTGVLLSTILTILLTLTTITGLYSRWASFASGILNGITFVLVATSSAIATAIAVTVKSQVADRPEVGIGVTVGAKMQGLMWGALALVGLSLVVQICLCCCCASRRDVRLGRRPGSREAYREVAESLRD
ncbi:MAG: hypothetical protein M1831_006664 [Alyxoria varia]|nr:MAG: hypothetical protein M1831_006664 [Alyxoria varia]